MPGIKAFYFVEKDDLKCNKDLLQKRFLRTIVVKETRKMHAFLTVSEKNYKCKNKILERTIPSKTNSKES